MRGIRTWGVILAGVLLVAIAVQMLPRYEWRVVQSSVIRVDRWTGNAVTGYFDRESGEWMRRVKPSAPRPSGPWRGWMLGTAGSVLVGLALLVPVCRMRARIALRRPLVSIAVGVAGLILLVTSVPASREYVPSGAGVYLIGGSYLSALAAVQRRTPLTPDASSASSTDWRKEARVFLEEHSTTGSAATPTYTSPACASMGIDTLESTDPVFVTRKYAESLGYVPSQTCESAGGFHDSTMSVFAWVMHLTGLSRRESRWNANGSWNW